MSEKVVLSEPLTHVKSAMEDDARASQRDDDRCDGRSDCCAVGETVKPQTWDARGYVCINIVIYIYILYIWYIYGVYIYGIYIYVLHYSHIIVIL